MSVKDLQKYVTMLLNRTKYIRKRLTSLMAELEILSNDYPENEDIEEILNIIEELDSDLTKIDEALYSKQMQLTKFVSEPIVDEKVEEFEKISDEVYILERKIDEIESYLDEIESDALTLSEELQES